MRVTRLLITTLIICCSQYCEAQADSAFQALENLQKIPVKYLDAVENKIDKYSHRITGKTEKTLTKLSKWENKIKNILEQVSPETSAKLFGNNATTFGSLLKKLQEGKAIAEGYKTKYNEYRDKLATSIKYLEDQKDKLDKKFIEPINSAKKKLNELKEDVSNTEAVEAFIKERKKQLITEAGKYVANSKYLTKIDKEAYYYFETLRNYKEIFSDKEKTEQTVLAILNKIPAFKNFVEQNSMLASLFPKPSNYGNAQSLAGLQTRTNINNVLRERLAAGGPNAQEQFTQNMKDAQASLNVLKEKVIKAGGNSSDAAIPNFKPNTQKTKTFKQRLEYSSNFQFSKPNNYIPNTADIGLSVGYKLNDKSIAGIGVSYKLGIGNIQRISISHQGIGLRSFVDWKLKKQFFVSGGFEMNYNATFKKVSELDKYSDWQKAGLIGISKKINIKTKFIKGTKMSLLYDFLARTHVPTSNLVVFRLGYSF